MSDDTTFEHAMSRIAELARLTLEAQTTLAKQSFELGRAAVTSEIDPLAAGRTWLEAVGRESSHYWSEAGSLGLDLAGELVALGTRGMSRVMTETQQTARRTSTRPEADHHTATTDKGTAEGAGADGSKGPATKTTRRRRPAGDATHKG